MATLRFAIHKDGEALTLLEVSLPAIHTAFIYNEMRDKGAARLPHHASREGDLWVETMDDNGDLDRDPLFFPPEAMLQVSDLMEILRIASTDYKGPVPAGLLPERDEDTNGGMPHWGMGSTMFSGSDSYAGTVLYTDGYSTAITQDDTPVKLGGTWPDIEWGYRRNPNGSVRIVHRVKYKGLFTDQWTDSGKKNGTSFTFGSRRYYRDPHF